MTRNGTVIPCANLTAAERRPRDETVSRADRHPCRCRINAPAAYSIMFDPAETDLPARRRAAVRPWPSNVADGAGNERWRRRS